MCTEGNVGFGPRRTDMLNNLDIWVQMGIGEDSQAQGGSVQMFLLILVLVFYVLPNAFVLRS